MRCTPFLALRNTGAMKGGGHKLFCAFPLFPSMLGDTSAGLIDSRGLVSWCLVSALSPCVFQLQSNLVSRISLLECQTGKRDTGLAVGCSGLGHVIVKSFLSRQFHGWGTPS